MRAIGIRELRQQASVYLRDVERGESIEVTDRGRPIAMIVPIPVETGRARLRAGGRLRPAEGDLLLLGDPLPARPGAPSPSAELERLRDDER